MTEKKQQSKLILYILINLTNILINLDHGIIPAATQIIKTSYNINQSQLGILGSVVFIGIVIAGTVAGRFYQKFQSKKLLQISLLLLLLFLLLFIGTNIYALAIVARFFTGAFQVFSIIYFPVWIDKYGDEKKTIWLTLLQIGTPLGIFFGYGLTSLIINFLGKSYWYISFLIQICLVGICQVILFFIKSQRLDLKGVLQIEQINDLLIVQGKKKKKLTYFGILKILINSKIYVIGVLTFSVLLFVSTGIQFWMTEYFILVLNQKPYIVNIGFAIVSITGPTLGTIFGGVVIHKIGGYQSPFTIYFVFLFSVIGMSSAAIIPFISNFYAASALLWTLLFFGGGMVPGLTGLILLSVSPQLRAFANSKAEIIKNLLGYFPSPFLYGLINNLSKNNRAGITLIMYYGMLAPALLGVGALMKIFNKQKGQINEIIKSPGESFIQNQNQQQEKQENKQKYQEYINPYIK